jgi:hypothetical protein
LSRTRIRCALVLTLGLIAAAPSGAAGACAAASAGSSNGQSALNGVYRLTWTEKQLIAAGMTRDYASQNHATLTLTLRNGRFRFQIKEEPSLRCTGGYRLFTVNGSKRFSTSFYNAGTCPEINATFAAIWSRPGGNLRFRVVTNSGEAGDEVIFGGKVWKKIS